VQFDSNLGSCRIVVILQYYVSQLQMMMIGVMMLLLVMLNDTGMIFVFSDGDDERRDICCWRK
jgi:hypothetical protein